MQLKAAYKTSNVKIREKWLVEEDDLGFLINAELKSHSKEYFSMAFSG